MKKITIITILAILFFITPVQARAGGGGSGGSGGSSSGNHNYYHASHSNGSSTPFAYIGIVLFAGATYFIKRSRIFSMNRKARKYLKEAKEKDEFWDKKNLLTMVEESYFQIQEAWSNQDMIILEKYLTPELYEQWNMKLSWQQYRNEKNILTKIRLISHYIVDINDDEDDTKDYFWIAIEGKIKDKIIRDDEIVEMNNNTFIEYWKFIRDGSNILLDEIRQEDEFE